jgi:hypothetical protein
MAKELPVVCSLDVTGLEQRLASIAEIGTAALISRYADGPRQVLRFRSSRETREGLERVVAAEAECCAFLDLSLREEGDELLLSVSAPEAGQTTADAFAAAFDSR